MVKKGLNVPFFNAFQGNFTLSSGSSFFAFKIFFNLVRSATENLPS
jgi:hypothetical protein